jgi:hypothetical protein
MPYSTLSSARLRVARRPSVSSAKIPLPLKPLIVKPEMRVFSTGSVTSNSGESSPSTQMPSTVGGASGSNTRQGSACPA